MIGKGNRKGVTECISLSLSIFLFGTEQATSGKECYRKIQSDMERYGEVLENHGGDVLEVDHKLTNRNRVDLETNWKIDYRTR